MAKDREDIEVTEGSLLAFLSQNVDFFNLDPETEVNVRMLKEEFGMTHREAENQMDRWVREGLIVATTNKRRCPYTNRPARAWRRVSAE